MKANFIKTRVVLLAVLITLAAGFNGSRATGVSTDTYTALIKGDQVVDCNTAYFTIWIKSPTGINFRTFQATIWISNAFLNTATSNVTVDWVDGTSDINAVFNTHQIIAPARGGITPGTGGDTSIIRLNTKSLACPGTLLTDTYQRIGQIRITRNGGASGCWGCADINNKLGWYVGQNAGLKTTFAITDWQEPYGSGSNVTLPFQNGTFLTDLNNQTPVITMHPSGTIVTDVTRAATFTVTAISVNPGDAAPTYQWYDYSAPTTPLTENSTFSGVTTSTLTVNDPDASLNGHKYFVTAKQCNSAISNPALLTVNKPVNNATAPINSLNPLATEGVNGVINLFKGSTTPSVAGTGSLSNRDATVGSPNAASFNLSAYPNPAHDQLTVSFNNSKQGGDYTLQVRDILGQVLMSQINTAQQGNNVVYLDLGGYAKGSYMISVTMGDGSSQQALKVVVE